MLHRILAVSVFAVSLTHLPAGPADLLPLNPAAPNFPAAFVNGVQTGSVTPQRDSFRAGEEMLLATYAYLSPESPVAGETAYRDRLLVLLDHRFGIWAGGEELRDIGSIWQATYAYFLLRHHRPGDISPARAAVYDAAIERNQESILTDNRLLYDDGILANLWLNGDIRLAKALYFGALIREDAATAAKAAAAIDGVMSAVALADGGTRYVGFWGEVATYHDESIRNLIYWWKINGSPAARRAIDGTLRYAVVANEPAGFVEQSSNIPYKHMYNNIRSPRSALWKAYLANDGYNYFFGKSEETASSTELLNVILYQPDRILRTPPEDVGVFWDGNIQGPRGRFGGTWGWIAHGRDVQRGGPEDEKLIRSQGYAGRQCGKSTFVGAYALGDVADKTPLKGALDSLLVEFKESAGAETDLMRGNRYRYLAQDEETRTITRQLFGSLSTSYRISRRTSASATPTWDASTTPWRGQQLWILTGERLIGLVQIVSDAASTVHGLDLRIVLTGGRRGIMGRFHELLQPDPTTFEFGELRLKAHLSTFTGTTTVERIAISDPSSTDDYSALIRIHDAAIAGDDAPVTYPAGTRRWMVIEITRAGVPSAQPVYNVLAGSGTWGVLQFHEGRRKIRAVQNLTGSTRNYTGNFVVGATWQQTTLHRSWSDQVTPLNASSGTAVVADAIPAYEHVVAVSSDETSDHETSHRTSAEVYGAPAYLNELVPYAFGNGRPVSAPGGGHFTTTFPRLRPDINYVVESSTDLRAWNALALTPTPVGQTASASEVFPLPGTPDFRFHRVLLDVPSPEQP